MYLVGMVDLFHGYTSLSADKEMDQEIFETNAFEARGAVFVLNLGAGRCCPNMIGRTSVQLNFDYPVTVQGWPH
jgi:hypothetical protein